MSRFYDKMLIVKHKQIVQRAEAIARALIMQPKILLLDEPTSANQIIF
jgi:ABC-type polar amino acid transport system ATPase subunit